MALAATRMSNIDAVIGHPAKVVGQSIIVKQPHRADLASFASREAAVIEWAVADTRLV